MALPPPANRLPIIAFGPNPWVEPQWMNRQNLLSRLAVRGWPIVYSNGALDIWQRDGQAWQGVNWRGRCVRESGVLIDNPGCTLPRWQKAAAWDQLALRSHATRLNKALAIKNGRGIALLFHPQYCPYVQPLGLRYLALHIYDNYTLQPLWTPLQAQNLARLVSRADLITCSSAGMAAALPPPGPVTARLLHNGADVDAFAVGAQAPCPPDLAVIPHPRIHYAGTLNRKVDFDLISDVATRRPQWHWVLVGQVEEAELLSDPQTRDGFLTCRTLRNVHFLGLKESRLIPPYVAHSDVNVMCYRTLGGWWRDGYPLKLHEYLAAGHPVVSGDLAAIRPFAHVVAIATGLDGWLRALEQAFSGQGKGTPAKRLEVAQANSWEHRADQWDEWLRGMIANDSQARRRLAGWPTANGGTRWCEDSW